MDVARCQDERESCYRAAGPGNGDYSSAYCPKISEDHNTISKGTQPRLLQPGIFLRQV